MVINADRPLVKNRRVVHFTGFEPLDFLQHKMRYERALAKSAKTFGFDARINSPANADEASGFGVEAHGPNWRTQSMITIIDHGNVVDAHLKKPLWLNIPLGFASAIQTILQGGIFAYLRNSWRFALFFLFPFLLIVAGLSAMVYLAALLWLFGFSLWHILWSAPVSMIAFRFGFVPWANRFSTMILFSNWQTAMDMATGRNANLNAQLEDMTEKLASALSEPADEYLVSSHSMGGAMLIHCLGAALERNPSLLDDKVVTVCTLGGAGLQCTLLRPAAHLRARARSILEQPNVVWLDVQSLTDVVNFYTKTGRHPHNAAAGKQPVTMHIRMKHMLSAETYRRIKRDFLRVHRQFVLGSDQRSAFDFSLLTAGPFYGAQFAEFSQGNLPPLGEDGAIIG